MSWAATTPSGTAVKFQLASSNSPSGPWTFLGPTGAASYYTTSGTAIPSTGSGAITGRYFQYQATLTGAGTSTPVLTRVVATFAGTNTSSLMSMVYDACGNITSLSRETASGTATEVRDNASWSATERINSLNQIKRNDVTPVGDRPPPIAILTMPTAPLPAKPTAPPPGPTPGILWAISAY